MTSNSGGMTFATVEAAAAPSGMTKKHFTITDPKTGKPVGVPPFWTPPAKPSKA